MFQINPTILVIPSAELRQLVAGPQLRLAGHAAFLEIAVAARGLEIAHLQFRFRNRTLALRSRVRGSGVVEIELGLGQASLPASVFTAEQLREAEEELAKRYKARSKGERPRIH